LLSLQINILPDGSGFVLEDVLNEDECTRVMDWGHELGFEDCGYSNAVRVTERVEVVSPQTAHEIYRRVSRFIKSVDLFKQHRGLRDDIPCRWLSPCGINPHFRVCRYQPRGFFTPHYDGAKDFDDCYSLQTFMLYLNDGYRDGTTRFFTDLQQHYKPGIEAFVTHRYHPKAGSALIFFHNITHDGEQVSHGQKYIMRSEVMYRQV